MKKRFESIFIFLLISFSNAFSQDLQENNSNKKYFSDGQEYMVLLKPNFESTIHVIFYPDLEYKIKISQELKTSIIIINVYNTNDSLLYTNSNKKYAKEWNFKFQSIINAKINLKLISNTSKEETARVQIAFRKLNKGA